MESGTKEKCLGKGTTIWVGQQTAWPVGPWDPFSCDGEGSCRSGHPGWCITPRAASLGKGWGMGCATWKCTQADHEHFLSTSAAARWLFCECVDPKTSLEKEDSASIFLPHQVFAQLGEHYPAFFQEQFGLGKDKLREFWSYAQKVGDDRLENHPMCLEKHWKDKCIPLFLHGDGVEYHSRGNLMVFSWGSMLGQGASLKQHWLLACYPKSCTCKSTWHPIWKWLKWSFEALGKGLHPTTDPDGKPLEKGSVFSAQAGKPLRHGYRAYVWAVMGDHEFYSNTLGLPHWASHYPCWECNAQNWAGCDPTLHYKQICLEKQQFEVDSHHAHLADPWSDHPVFQLPHVSSRNVRGDPMHILFCKGLYGHLIGSILHYLCYHEGPG